MFGILILDRTYIGRIVGFADGEELRNNQAIELSVEKNMVASNAEPVKDERPSGVPHLASGSGA